MAKIASTIKILKNDSYVQRLNYKSRKIKVNYLLLRKEISSFVPRTMESPGKRGFFDYDQVINNVRRIQAYMDRVVQIRMDLHHYDRRLEKLLKRGSSHLESFAIVKDQKTKEQREKLISRVLNPISDKLAIIEELLQVTEELQWNLKHAFNVNSLQSDLAKQSQYLRNPERLMDKKERR